MLNISQHVLDLITSHARQGLPHEVCGYLAEKDGKIVGRIATCVNYQHNEFHMEKTGFFGFFDVIDDYEIASKLLKVAMITLKKEGMEKMRGPTNFSTNQEIGFLIE